MQRAARPHLQIDLVDQQKALEKLAGTPRTPADLAAAKTALTKARAAYKQLRFSVAVATLQTAQATLVAAAQSKADFAILGEIALWRGIAHLALKQEDAARQALGWAMTLGQRGGGGRFAPEVQRFVDEVEKNRGKGSLTITAQPAGATIWVNGVDRGVAPATITLGGGLHHVRITQLGRREQVLLPVVQNGKVDRVSAELKQAAAPEIARQLIEAANKKSSLYQSNLAALLSIDAAVVIGGSAGRPSASVAWLKPGAKKKPLSCPAAAKDTLSACLADSLFVLATGSRPPGRQSPKGAAFYRRWWFWTAVGTAVAAGSGVAIYASTRDTSGVDVYIESKK